MKNYSQSVKDKIKAIFRTTKEPYDRLLLQYAMERCLYRISTSELNSKLILKGGILFYVWTKKKFRPTKDLDFSYYGEFEEDSIFESIKEICQTDIPEDGLVFDNFRMSKIKEDHEYEGLRINFDGMLQKTKIPMQFDISTGDKITPDTEEIEFPQLITLEAANINTYPKETVFAEKAEAMVKLDIGTSRMKDIYDLYILIELFGNSLDKEILQTAIRITFDHRGTKLPTVPVKVFSAHFYDNLDKVKEWKAFIRSSSSPDLSLEEAITTIAGFINPLMS